MPVYNGSAYIGESVESVLAQSHSDFYLKIFDNCSTDGTFDVIRKFKDSRIQYIRNEKNLGLVGNHQRCIERCETKYLNIWHHDDIMLPTNLEKKIKLLDKMDNVGLVFSNVELIDENGKKLDTQWNNECNYDYVKTGHAVFLQYIKRMPIGALFFIGSVLGRKKCLVRAGGFRMDYSPLTCDSEIFLRTLLCTDVACLGEPLIRYRNYTGSTTSQYPGTDFFQEHLQVVDKIFKELPDQIPDFESLREYVQKAFAEKAIYTGLNACGNNDFEAAHKYLQWGKIIFPHIARTLNYWRLMLRLTMGPKAVGVMRPFKRRIQKLISLP